MDIGPDLRILMLQLDDPGRDALERVIARAQAEAKQQRAVATTQPQPQARERKHRKPNIAKMLARARKAGATEVIAPDGYRVRFAEEQNNLVIDGNPWDAAADALRKKEHMQ
jgi:hypothetical protein